MKCLQEDLTSRLPCVRMPLSLSFAIWNNMIIHIVSSLQMLRVDHQNVACFRRALTWFLVPVGTMWSGVDWVGVSGSNEQRIDIATSTSCRQEFAHCALDVGAVWALWLATTQNLWHFSTINVAKGTFHDRNLDDLYIVPDGNYVS